MAGTAEARAPKPTSKALPNGTYYGYYASGRAVFAGSVSRGKLSAVYAMSPVSTGPGMLYTSIGVRPGSSVRGHPWSSEPLLNVGAVGYATSPVCGNVGPGAKLGVSFRCTAGSGGGFMSGKPQFTARRASTPGPSNGTYSGTVTTQTTKGTSVGTSGSLTLAVANAAVSGSATFAPVDPTTGVASGPPSINVTYGPIQLGTNQNASDQYDVVGEENAYAGPILAEDCSSVAGGVSSFLTSQGMFCLPSTPAGYTLIGGFVPAGVPGLPKSGLVAGTVYTAPTVITPDSLGMVSYGPALPGSFAISRSTP